MILAAVLSVLVKNVMECNGLVVSSFHILHSRSKAKAQLCFKSNWCARAIVMTAMKASPAPMTELISLLDKFVLRFGIQSPYQ